MCDRRTDPTDLQTSLQTRSSLLFSSLNMILKLQNFFSSFNLTALLIMWSLFKKYCSSFLHQKPCKFIYAVSNLSMLAVLRNVTFQNWPKILGRCTKMQPH